MKMHEPLTPHASEADGTWRGYGIDELRYQRAYALARCEIEKMKLTSRVDSAKESLPSLRPTGIAGRLLKGLSYMDYAYFAFKAVSKITRLIRHKR